MVSSFRFSVKKKWHDVKKAGGALLFRLTLISIFKEVQ